MRLAAGLAFVAIYALPLYAPPAVSAFGVNPASHDLAFRLFPGVPAFWVFGRLACLALGAWLLATLTSEDRDEQLLPGLFPGVFVPIRAGSGVASSAAASAAPGAEAGAAVGAASEPQALGHHGSSESSGRTVPTARVLALAGAMAAVQLLVAAFALGALGPIGQVAFVLSLPLPALVVLVGSKRTSRGSAASDAVGSVLPDPVWRRALFASALVAAFWWCWWVRDAFSSPRTANPVDMWQSFRWLVEALGSGANPLSESGQPGISNGYMILLGTPLLGGGDLQATATTVLAIHGLWTCAAIVGVGLMAGALLGVSAVLPASCMFAFSPFVAWLAYSVSPFGIFLLLAVVLVGLTFEFYRRGSDAVLIGLGAVAGTALMSAYLYPAVGLCGLVVGAGLLRRRRLFSFPVLVGTLGFLAAALPYLPDAESLEAMVSEYVNRQGSWPVLEAHLFGRLSLAQFPSPGDIWMTGERGPFDLLLGALLSPFASARTSLRLWGDVIFDPLTAALAAVGIVVSLRRCRWDRSALVLLLTLILALAPAALASAYDRASLTRNLLLPFPIVLLAVVGFRAVLRPWGRLAFENRAGVLVGLLVAFSGIFLFDVVNPRILVGSAQGVTVELLAGSSAPSRIVGLVQDKPYPQPWLHLDLLPGALVDETVEFAGTSDFPATELRELSGKGGQRDGSLVLWISAIEADHGMRKRICDADPHASVYRVADPSGLIELWAAWFGSKKGSPAWTPPLPASRWRRVPCSAVSGAVSDAVSDPTSG